MDSLRNARVALVMLVLGFSLALYAGGNAVRAIVEGGFLHARRMEHRIMGMRDRFVVCGFGRMGQVLEAGDMLIVLAARASLERVAALGRSESDTMGGTE